MQGTNHLLHDSHPDQEGTMGPLTEKKRGANVASKKRIAKKKITSGNGNLKFSLTPLRIHMVREYAMPIRPSVRKT